jgi:hypothetical protein
MTEDELKQQSLYDYLSEALRGQGAVDLRWAALRTPMDPYWMQTSLPEVEALATQLLDDAEFRAIQLGTWLDTPDGQLISSAVLTLLPPAYRPETKLLVEALQLAAQMQQDAGKQRAGRVLIGSLGVAALIAIARL